MHPTHCRGRERAEHALQRIIRRQLVVTEREHNQRRELLDPTPKERQHVEGRPIGPVDVLDDPHRPRHARQLRSDSLEQLGTESCTQRLPERRRRLIGEVANRAERARHDEVVAPAPDDARSPRALGERANERRLADPRLACDQYDGAGGRGRRKRGVERLQLRFALHERHVVHRTPNHVSQRDDSHAG